MFLVFLYLLINNSLSESGSSLPGTQWLSYHLYCLQSPRGTKVELLVDLLESQVVLYSTSWNNSFPCALIAYAYQLRLKSLTLEFPYQNLTGWSNYKFLIGQVLVGSHIPSVPLLYKKAYLCFKQALSIVSVQVGSHSCEMPFQTPPCKPCKRAHNLNYPIIPIIISFLPPLWNLP